MHVAAGDVLVLTAPERAQAGELGVTFAALLAEVVAPGDEVLIDDGRIRARAEGSDGTRLVCRVEIGGTIKPSKGVNLPSSTLPIPALTEKDRVDLEFALAAGADYVALSFVRTAGDVAELRSLIDAAGSPARIVAKIEKAEAVVNLDSIIEAADAVMVARGDLGVEIGVSQVPLVQKRIIERARAAGRAVITATQMLESMIHEPEPTRAEVSDVANAILDGTSAVMLSAETAAGDFPLRAVAQMDAIARSVEPSLGYERRVSPGADVAEILTHGACDLADDVGAAVIAVPTETGATARLVSRFRPQGPIVAASKDACVLQQLALEWAVVPLLVDEASSIEAGWADIIRRVLEHGLADAGRHDRADGSCRRAARRLDEPRLPAPRRGARGRPGSCPAPRPAGCGRWRRARRSPVVERADELLRRFGSPLYVYDLREVERRYARFVQAFPYRPFECHYAIVCNKNPLHRPAAARARGRGAREHAGRRLRGARGRRAGGGRSSTAGRTSPAPTSTTCSARGVALNVDSLDQLRDVVRRGGCRSVGLRFLIDDPAKRNRIGVAPRELREALRIARRPAVCGWPGCTCTPGRTTAGRRASSAASTGCSRRPRRCPTSST